VLLYFDDETGFEFPPHLGNDWTVIDEGEVIGITQRVGDFYEARWYFGNRTQAQSFGILQERLSGAAEPYKICV
jgi:hypothetical protein